MFFHVTSNMYNTSANGMRTDAGVILKLRGAGAVRRIFAPNRGAARQNGTPPRPGMALAFGLVGSWALWMYVRLVSVLA